MDAYFVKQLFENQFNRTPDLLVRACGRINLIGEHTDYNDGFVLPAAIDRFIFYALAENGTDTCHFYAADMNEKGSAALHDLKKTELQWLNYLQGIIQQFQLEGKTVRGVDVVLGGNLPVGSGMSSSAALECGFGWALNRLFDAGFSKSYIAELAHHSSNQFMGIPSGIMDQFASMMGKANHFILLDCRSLEHRYIPADLKAYQIVLINSKVHHELSSSEYPVRVAECKAGVQYLQQFDPNVKSLRDVTPELLEAHKDGLSDKIYRRCKYVVTEEVRTLQACEYLQKGEIEKVGKLMFRTHAGLRDDYEVSCPEIDFLVDFAKEYEGVAGARIMGGGFGGCTINLVKKDAVNDFIHKAEAAYYDVFNIKAEHYLLNISDGTDVVGS
ncbi:MAG: galactokinase [Saprospiraceae bacterium]